MEICNPSCNGTQIRSYPIPCNTVSSTRKGGFERFMFIDCDVVMSNVTSPAEWQALIDDDRIIISPPGFGKLSKPELKKEKLKACSPEQTIDEITGFEYETKLFDNVTQYDFDFENDVKEKHTNKNVVWIGCDGLLYYNYKWVAGTNPGFSGIAAEVYRDSEVDSLQKLHIDVKFNTYQKGLKGIPLPQTVLDVLFAA